MANAANTPAQDLDYKERWDDLATNVIVPNVGNPPGDAGAFEFASLNVQNDVGDDELPAMVGDVDVVPSLCQRGCQVVEHPLGPGRRQFGDDL